MADSSPGPVEQWSAVERYITDSMLAPDPVLDSALADSVRAGLPAINVGPNQGKLLQLLAQICGARKILEIGTLAGYSTIWLSRALPANGRLITLEFEPKHAAVARANFERAGLNGLIDVRIGAATDLLPKIAAAGEGPFDLIFIDANKDSIPEYFAWALKLSRPGSVIVVDNVIRNGAVLDVNSTDKDVRGVRRFYELLRTERRVSATALQTVGSKGYDGFAVLLVTAEK
jgi:predicted O-methyltransferase YrrM